MKKRIGIAVLGLGWMGQAHSRAALRISSLFPDAEFKPELVVCADVEQSRRDRAVNDFGFALFYLRGIADTLFKDKRISEAVKSNDIYLGAIPWVCMQVILVGIVIFVPQSVTMFLDKEIIVDIDKVKIEMPPEEVMPAAALKPGELPVPVSTEPLTAAETDKAADKAAADEQKKIDELFKK